MICPNLEAGVRIGDGWVTISYSPRPGREGRTRYKYTIIRKDAPDITGDDQQSGCQGGNLREGLESLLSFLGAFASANNPGYADMGRDENDDLFPKELGEWAYLNSDEIGMAQCEVEETKDCINEETHE